jgi:hypothetical protein
MQQQFCGHIKYSMIPMILHMTLQLRSPRDRELPPQEIPIPILTTALTPSIAALHTQCFEMTEPSTCCTPKVPIGVSSLAKLLSLVSSIRAALSCAAHFSWSRLKKGAVTRTSSRTNATSMNTRLRTRGKRNSWVAFCKGALAT